MQMFSIFVVDIELILLSVAVALGLAVTQSFICAKIGSDHPVHAFLVRAIRQNGHSLFVRIPKLLNTAYCAALPLYLHWLLSFCPPSVMHWAERLLNPIVNVLHVLLFAGIACWFAASAGLPPLFVGLATAMFALTPQTYHALSARNFGLSARGTGLLLLTGFFAIVLLLETGTLGLLGWFALAMLGWLVWSFSTFAQQALCILSLLLLLSGRWIPLTGTVLGLGLFLVLHPAYGSAYLRHTLRFIHVYATELAPIYILNRHPSVWRDLVQDIWAKFRSAGVRIGFRYAYENSIVILLITNPFVLAGAGAAVFESRLPPLFAFAADLSLVGLLAMLATSLRLTRFLGEPERYIEVVTPWAVLVGARLLYDTAGLHILALVAALFLLMNLGQIFISHLLVRHVTAKPVRLDEVEAAVAHHVSGEVRLCSNNEQLTKMLMANDWCFSYCIAVGQPYGGMSITEAFSTFPNLRREACQRLVTRYRLNVCVLDRTVFDTLFDCPPAELEREEVLYESTGLRVLALHWKAVA